MLNWAHKQRSLHTLGWILSKMYVLKRSFVHKTAISPTPHSHSSLKCLPIVLILGGQAIPKNSMMGKPAGWCRRGELSKIALCSRGDLFDGILPFYPTWISLKRQMYPRLVQNCKGKHLTENQVSLLPHPHPNPRVYMRSFRPNIHWHTLFWQKTAKRWWEVTLNLHHFIPKSEIPSAEVPTPHTIAELGKQSCKLLMKHLSLFCISKQL